MVLLRRLSLIALLAFLFVVAVGRLVGNVVQWLGDFIRAEFWNENLRPVESVLALAAQSKYRIALFLLAAIGIGCVFTWASRRWGQWRRRKAAVKRYGADAKLPCVCLSDAPLGENDEDLLERGSTEELLAYYMMRCLGKTQSGRIGVFGEWGSGKTSVLNRAIARMDRYEKVPTVVRFEAWRCSNRKDVVYALYSSAAKQCYLEGRYALAVAFLSLAVSSTSLWKIKYDDLPALLLAAIGWLVNSFVDARRAMEKACDSGRVHTVVVVDDVDRLPYALVRELLCAIAAVGDLPGLNYVVAADKSYLADAFDAEAKGHGTKYWEKLFPVVVHLPEISPLGLLAIIRERIESVHKALEVEYRADEANDLPFVRLHLTNYRSVVRIVNEVAMQLSRMKVKAPKLRMFHLGDLIELSALRLFEPEIYENLYRYRFPLLATRHTGMPPIKYTKNDLLAMLCPGPTDEARIDALFGFLRNHLSYIKTGDEDAYFYMATDEFADANLRLASRKCFPNYFDASVGEMARFVYHKGDFEKCLERGPDEAFEYFLQLEKKHFLVPFLGNYKATFRPPSSKKAVDNLLLALIRLADESLTMPKGGNSVGAHWLSPYVLAAQLVASCIDWSACSVGDVVEICLKNCSLNMTGAMLQTAEALSEEPSWSILRKGGWLYRRVLLIWMQELERAVVGHTTGVFALPNGMDLYTQWGQKAYDIITDGEERDANLLVRGQRFQAIQSELVKVPECAKSILADCQGWLESSICPAFFKPVGFERLEARLGLEGVRVLTQTLKDAFDMLSLEMASAVLVLEDYLNDPQHRKGPKEQAKLVKEKFAEG